MVMIRYSLYCFSYILIQSLYVQDFFFFFRFSLCARFFLFFIIFL